MPPKVHMLQGGPPDVLPAGYGYGLQLRWTTPVEHFRVESRLLRRKNVLLGREHGIEVALDFPNRVDNVHATWADVAAGSDAHIVDLKTVGVRAKLPPEAGKSIAAAANLGDDLYYGIAREVALELLERLFNAIARRSASEAPRLEAYLPVGLCQVFYGRKQRAVSAAIEMTLFTLSSPVTDTASLPTLLREAATPRTLDLAWRLYRRARRLSDAEDSLAEAIIIGLTAFEVGITSALVSKAPSTAAKAAIENAKLAHLMSSAAAAKAKKADWQTLLLGATFDIDRPAEFNVINGMRVERNKIAHEGRLPISTWLDVRRQLEAVRQSLLWLESRL